jgi:ribosome modulation factor
MGQSCWDAGYRAGIKGKLLSDCPFRPGSRRKEWVEGWRIATEPMAVRG